MTEQSSITAYRGKHTGRIRIENGHTRVRAAEAEGQPTITVFVEDEGNITLHLTPNGYQEKKSS